ncbi:hypothetical protein JX266_010281 [Neoarthrinium moseri]|nr:hypothetical protein JX266_010281 [Neoarthrinium moseri]
MVTPTRTSSPPLPTQSDLLGDNRLPRRLFRIQSKQKQLLDQADSWAQHLRRQPKPGVNLPPEILENLRNFHKRQTEINKAGLPGPEAAQDGPVETPSSPGLPPLGSEDGATAADEDAGTPVSGWETSPEPQRQIEAETLRFQSQSPLQDSFAEHIAPEPFMSQVPARSPLRPTLDAANVQKRPAFTDFPSSSLDAEEELEVVAPNALTKQLPALQRASELNPTPPSAQVQVPCTFEPDSSVSEPQARNTGARPYSNLASIQTVQRRVAGSRAKTTAVAGRMHPPAPRARHGYDVGILDSQSSVDSSPSIVPATGTGGWEHSPSKSPKGMPIKSTIMETPRVSRSLNMQSRQNTPSDQMSKTPTRSSPDIRQHSPEYRPASPQVVEQPSPTGTRGRAIEQYAPANQTPSPLPLPEAKLAAPFIQYSVSYPSYTGSVGDFVNACLTIQVLQRRRALASYQYDDFIRAWSDGYMPYIESSEDSGKELTAIEWYMDRVDEALFTSKIITKDTLEAALAFYADEVRARRRSKNPSLETTPALVPAEQVPIHEQTVEEAPSKDETIQRGIQGHPQAPGDSIGVGEANAAKLPGAEVDQDIGVHGRSPSVEAVPSEDELPSVAQKLPTPQVSKPSRKRCLDDDIDDDDDDEELEEPAPKRSSRGSLDRATKETHLPRSDGNVRSHRAVNSKAENKAPRASGEPRSTGLYLGSKMRLRKNPAKRSEKFEKYLVNLKSGRINDDISVASSAPVNATPRSGQEEKRGS